MAKAADAGTPTGAQAEGRSLWADARRRFLRNRAAIVSLCLLAVIGLACSHVADGFNLAAHGIAGTGTRNLDPGDILSGTVTMDAARTA